MRSLLERLILLKNALMGNSFRFQVLSKTYLYAKRTVVEYMEYSLNEGSNNGME